jgi:oxygen tolerance protein BatD
MFRGHKKYLAFIVAATLLATSALAEEPSVTAVLTNSQTVLGRPVQLQIKITGSPSARPPDVISVDGLDIRYTGQSQMIEGRNFQFSYSFVYSYTVMPERTGTFRIPPQRIQAGSNALRTPELTLNVVDSGRQTQRSGRSAASLDARKLVAAELVLTKTAAYVGELIPAEVRLYINSRTRANIKDGPEVSGQGFTMQKLSQATQSRENVGGQYYDVFTFKTAIAAARTGRFEIGPVKATATVLVPRQINPGGRSPFDIFNMDDPFSDPFFADPFGHSLERQEIDVESKPVTLEVKPLPPNAPSEFSGAIGTFTMEADAKPKSVQVGDPITVTANISGRGNFDRVTAPVLENEHGWHKYPPSANFKQDDDVGISGIKTFETVLTPNESKKSVPPFVFSFFDPINEKYVTLRSDAIPVKIEGAAIADKPATAAAPAQAATPQPEQKAEDILYQFSNWPGTTETFAPIYMRSNFWLAQTIPLVALLGFVGWKWRRARLGDREARRRAHLQHEAAEVQKRLRRADIPSQEYYTGAARAVQLKTALAKNVNPNTVDAGTAADAFRLDETMRSQLETLFKQKDELRYSGRPNGEGTVSPNEQREVLELIEHLRV